MTRGLHRVPVLFLALPSVDRCRSGSSLPQWARCCGREFMADCGLPVPRLREASLQPCRHPVRLAGSLSALRALARGDSATWLQTERRLKVFEKTVHEWADVGPRPRSGRVGSGVLSVAILPSCALVIRLARRRVSRRFFDIRYGCSLLSRPVVSRVEGRALSMGSWSLGVAGHAEFSVHSTGRRSPAGKFLGYTTVRER